MVQRINKETDLVFNIRLNDRNGVPFRVRNTTEFVLHLYTINPDEFIECSFKNGFFNGIIECDEIDEVIINSNELSKLQSGLICYSYNFKSPSPLFDDAYYNEEVKGQTDFYLN